MSSNRGVRRQRPAGDDAGEPPAQRRRLDPATESDDENGELTYYDGANKYTHLTMKELDSMDVDFTIDECLYCVACTDREEVRVSVLDESGAINEILFFPYFMGLLLSRVQMGSDISRMVADVAGHVRDALKPEQQADLLERGIRFSEEVLTVHLLRHSSITYFKDLEVCRQSFTVMQRISDQLVGRDNKLDASNACHYTAFHKIYNASVERIEKSSKAACIESLKALFHQL